MVPPTLKGAVDGRGRLDLGVPPAAELGDVLESLFRLYPKLAAHIASDKRSARAGLNLFVSEQMLRDFSLRRFALRDGQKLYLSAGATARKDA